MRYGSTRKECPVSHLPSDGNETISKSAIAASPLTTVPLSSGDGPSGRVEQGGISVPVPRGTTRR